MRGPDGIQRVRVLAGSYFFRPRQIRVAALSPVELTVVLEPGLIPHDFVIDAPKAGITVRETLGDEPRVIRFMPAVPGIFEFYCSKRLLFFESHKDKGHARGDRGRTLARISHHPGFDSRRPRPSMANAADRYT